MDKAHPTAEPKTHMGFFDRIAAGLVTKHLKSITSGKLVLQTSNTTLRFGETEELQANLHVHRSRFFRQAVLGGPLSFAESYLHGDWDSDDLTSLLRILARNQSASSRFKNSLTFITSLGHKLYHWCRANSIRGSRQNIAAHYDLGNDFYRLWLDDTMAYSSGIFLKPDASLRDASIEKIDRACRKLGLQETDHLVEIGTGWGGLSLHAAENYGCRVTTTTISKQQHEIAERRFAESESGNRIHLLQEDYRNLQGTYDKLVSIEMIEAVGHKYLDQYFSKCSQLLRPDGTMVLQAIVMPERGYQDYLKSVDFIQRFVFPGGCLPSVGSMLEAAGRSTDLRFVHAEDFAPHYAETLRRWRQAFHAHRDTIVGMGYTDYFIRLWHYYLCYCEAAFEERCVGVVQIQFDKPLCRRDPLELSYRAAAGQQQFERPEPIAHPNDRRQVPVAAV